VTTLVLSPDYASHYAPLSVLASALARRGEAVVVATGPSMAARAARDGFAVEPLTLGRSSNSGRADQRVDAGVRDFLAATREGPVATLALQARDRSRDLLWEPQTTAEAVARIVERVRPDRIVVDQVSVVSTLAVHALDRPFVTVVPGHPGQLPVGDEHYGLPPVWPAALPAVPDELDALARQVTAANRQVTEQAAAALAAMAPGRPAPDDVFRLHGELVVYHWPAWLHEPSRAGLLPAGSVSAGPLVRPPGPVADLVPPVSGRPLVYVALGTFLAHRGDVLAVVAEALRRLDVRAAIATGPTPPARIGPVPDDWLVAPVLPQVACLDRASLAVSHGGNNSVQEALAAGLGSLVLPFSTDQFAIAADLERVGLAHVADPNHLDPDVVAGLVDAGLRGNRPDPEPTAVEVAVDAVLDVGRVTPGG
jgi:zeaxanthin glucosyltransferase